LTSLVYYTSIKTVKQNTEKNTATAEDELREQIKKYEQLQTLFHVIKRRL